MGFAELKTNIETAIGKIIKLEIKTVVGTFAQATEKDPWQLKGDGHYLGTTIDLVQGDITDQIDEWFLAPERKALLDMHAQREKQGGDIIKGNVQALKELWLLVDRLMRGSTEPGT